MLQQRFYLILQSSQPVLKVPAFWQMFYYTIHSEKIKAFAFKWLDGKRNKNTALCCVAAGMIAHLTDIRLSLSESLLFWILFCVVRKSSFWMVSHVINLFAAFPLNSNTKREKYRQIWKRKASEGSDGILLLEDTHERVKGVFRYWPKWWILMEGTLRMFRLIKRFMWERIIKGGARDGREWYWTIRL